ncbi:protein LZIC-like [Atheta coriaria]|uniref:protein LZIC-like n=1 Tax=Dalotia coriaria TaxID=877792 RepID=UPI0031F430CD
MTSHGKNETELLKKNMESQLDRLIEQLKDLEEAKDELDAEEYEEARQDTLDQLQEFNDSLAKLAKGDISLVNTMGAMQLAIQSAISGAFNTNEVIKLFGKMEPQQLKEKLTGLEAEYKLNKITKEAFDKLKVEILIVLRQLGEELSVGQLCFLDEYTNNANNLSNVEFVEVNE